MTERKHITEGCRKHSKKEATTSSSYKKEKKTLQSDTSVLSNNNTTKKRKHTSTNFERMRIRMCRKNVSNSSVVNCEKKRVFRWDNHKQTNKEHETKKVKTNVESFCSNRKTMDGYTENEEDDFDDFMESLPSFGGGFYSSPQKEDGATYGPSDWESDQE